jgi:hypothetical protein
MTGLGAGLSYSQWVADVVPASDGGNGQWNARFLDWRVQVLNNLVANMTTWIHQIRSNVTIAATAWDYGFLNPYYWRYYIGLDPSYWAYDGSVNWICPMMYGPYNDSDDMQGFEQWSTGGAHGMMPLVPFITDLNNNANLRAGNMTLADWDMTTSSILQNGADGVIIWEYGGPGDNPYSGSPDIRPYLSALGWPNPPTFAMSATKVAVLNSTSVQISWTTSLPSTSLVEYSENPLFNATLTGTSPDDYYQINHNRGTIVSSTANVTSHAVTLTSLKPVTNYYFRVQSQDLSGIATSNVLTFNTE